MIVSFIFLIASFVYIAFMGKLPLSGFLQLVPIIILFSIPSAITGILPNAIIADCAVYDAHTTGENKEALYFGLRSFLNKLGATIAALILPSLLALGKSVNNDLGIRISVIVAAVVVVISLFFFLKYDEKEILDTIAKYEEE